MASFEDLAPFTLVAGERLVAVGWLDPERPFPTATPDMELVRALQRRTFGWPGPQRAHRCALCSDSANAPLGVRLVIVFGPEQAYVAPELISHYISEHHYAPPVEFVKHALSPEQHRGDLTRHFPAESAHMDVQSLASTEFVRRRPGMYVGDTQASGLQHVFFEVLSNALDQHLATAAERVDVTIEPDGWVTVEDDGTGIAVKAMYNGVPAIEAIFARLHTGATLDNHFPHVHARAGLAGVGVACVNALSRRFEVETWRDGVAWRAAFERGQLVEPLTRVGETTKHGTRIRYLADDGIFDTVHLDVRAVKKRLTELAWLCPKLDLRFQRRSLKKPGGLAAWLPKLVRKAVPQTVLSGSGTHADVGVDFALAWKPGAKKPWVRSFVNYGETAQGGSHVKGLAEAIARSAPTPELASTISRGLVGVVHVTLLDPRFHGPTKALLHVDEAQAAVEQVVREALAKNPAFWDWLLENASPE